MKKKLLYIMLLLTVFAPLGAQRIISTAPALTEIVFALGFGEKIVGNTRFCDFPEKARHITKIGGFIDLNREIVAALKPDIIFHYPASTKRILFMQNRCRLVRVKNNSLEDMYQAMTTMALALNSPARGQQMVANIQSRLDAVKKANTVYAPLRVILVAGRNPEMLNRITLMGRHNFLDQILEMAGGINAYAGSIPYPDISLESVMSMNPQCIIELTGLNSSLDSRRLLESWEKSRVLPLSAAESVKIIKDPLWLRPGPRVCEIAEKMAAFISKTRHLLSGEPLD